jgi:hypothetical protein
LTIVDIFQRVGQREYRTGTNGNGKNETAQALQPGTAAKLFPQKICFQGLYPFMR